MQRRKRNTIPVATAKAIEDKLVSHEDGVEHVTKLEVEGIFVNLLEEIKPDRLAEFKRIADEAAGHAVGRHIGHSVNGRASFKAEIAKEIDAAIQRNNVTVGEFIGEALAPFVKRLDAVEALAAYIEGVANASFRDIGRVQNQALGHDTQKHGKIAPVVGEVSLFVALVIVVGLACLGAAGLVTVLVGALS